VQKIIFIKKQTNPKLYKVLLRKGGTVKINNVTMTILKPKRTFLDSLIYRVKSLFLRA
jgi:hypothetical protein